MLHQTNRQKHAETGNLYIPVMPMDYPTHNALFFYLVNNINKKELSLIACKKFHSSADEKKNTHKKPNKTTLTD